jgi:hypothetical protein
MEGNCRKENIIIPAKSTSLKHSSARTVNIITYLLDMQVPGNIRLK